MLKENKAIDISKHPLLKKCYEVALAIESSGANPNLTKATVLVNQLFKELDYYITLINELNEDYQDEYRVFKDGSAWCATGPEFISLQMSPAGFGFTPLEALEQLFTV